MILSRSDEFSSFRWNENAGRYISNTGRFISADNVRIAYEGAITNSRARIRALSESLQNSGISLADWQTQMIDEIRIVNNMGAALARGGWAEMSQSDWGFVGSVTRRQYDFLSQFALDIENGLPLDGRFLQRADLYGSSYRGTLNDMKRRMETSRGRDEERRVLGVADHCQSAGGLTGCVELAGQGWQPINSLPRIGTSPCRTNCQCHFEFRTTGGESTE